jgi:pimeloyl-ACP methyl ester carboxylesterase
VWRRAARNPAVGSACPVGAETQYFGHRYLAVTGLESQTMKIACFHLMPYRDLEPDFEIDNLWDAVIAYEDFLDGLGLKKFRLKGLKKRIHRISAPSLIVCDENDRLIPPVYAEEFGRCIPHAQHLLLPQCGHEPPLKLCEALVSRVRGFFEAQARCWLR